MQDPTRFQGPLIVTFAYFLLWYSLLFGIQTRTKYRLKARDASIAGVLVGLTGTLSYLEWISVHPIPKLQDYTLRAVPLATPTAAATKIGDVQSAQAAPDGPRRRCRVGRALARRELALPRAARRRRRSKISAAPRCCTRPVRRSA
ncbi:MAG: hypothetical protein IT375_34515 [Polyangiaceae bacterium]|nr:hypothetical protein [Polyangiaceae bacterium]